MSQEAKLVDRQGSPKRRQVDELSILPVFAEQDDQEENKTNDENPHESTPGEQEIFKMTISPARMLLITRNATSETRMASLKNFCVRQKKISLRSIQKTTSLLA